MLAAQSAPVAPLPGPFGLYNVSVLPRFVCDSTRVGWQGAFFTTIVGAPQGRVDHVHERYCLQRALGPTEIRPSSGRGWELVQTGFAAWRPGDETRGAWRHGRRCQFLFIAPEYVEQVLEGRALRLPRVEPKTPLRSRMLDLLFDALDEDLMRGSPGGALVGDGLIASVVGHLSGLGEHPPAALAPSARQRVIDYIDARFAQPLQLAELAVVAGVGVRQFNRSFRAATGESPHQFVLGRRVEHAKRLIAQGVALADIAIQCGFADQSQFTRTFALRVGATPSRYRASLRC